MAIQYPSYAIPQPGDFLSSLSKGYQFGQNVQQDLKDRAAEEAAAGIGQNGSALAALSQQQPPQPAQPAIGPDGRPVAVGDRAAELRDYEAGVSKRESGGNPNAVNPTTGATGQYQFLPSTWADVGSRHPELGLTPDGITDPGQQQKAMAAFTSDNARQLQAAGVAPNPANLYAAHFLGAAGATKVLSAPDQTPMSALVPEAVAANPNIASMSVGDFKAWAGQNGANPSGGYAPPAAQQQPQAGPQTGGNGLPDRETMLALFRSPETRPLAQQMVTAVQSGQSPAGLLDLALKRAQITQTGLQPGYRWNADHSAQEPVPGGPDDPNNPLNSNRVIPFAGANGLPIGTTGSSTVDPGADGYSTRQVIAGLTQAAIDQQARSNLLSGNSPPGGRSGVAGARSAAISNRMAELDPTGNLAANKTQLKALSSTLTQQQQYLNNTERAFNTANDTLANLQDYMTKNGINPSQFPDYNRFTNFLKAKGLDPGASGGYNAQLATLRQEYSQVLAKGGVRSVETDREASQLIPDGLSPSQLAQVAAQIKIDSDNAINEANGQVSKINDQINGLARGQNAPATAAPAAAAPSANAAPAVGATKTVGGKTYILQNDGWYEQ